MNIFLNDFDREDNSSIFDILATPGSRGWGKSRRVIELF